MADVPPPRMSFKERNATLNDRIRNSETFPRIRDLEAALAEEQNLYVAKIENKLLRRKGKPAKPLPPRILTKSSSPSKSSAAKAELVARDFFSTHVLNKDPGCSKYMPFDKVFYPRLFNNNESSHVPESLDLVWMLGFQHLAEHSSSIVQQPQPKKRPQAPARQPS